MIDITGVDLVKFAQKVYELSSPQGMGFLHYTPEPLSEEEAKQLVGHPVEHPDKLGMSDSVVLDMDYVRGRACKMTVWKEEGRLVINDNWYDHTDRILDMLLKEFGFSRKIEQEHGCACGCIDCQSKRAVEGD